MNIGKTIVLARRTFVGKVMSLLFNMLSRKVMGVHIIIHLPKLMEHATPRINPGVNCGLWVTMICQWMLTDCNKHQFSSVAQLCPTFCDPMDRSTPGFPVHHQHQHNGNKKVSNGISLNLPLNFVMNLKQLLKNSV